MPEVIVEDFEIDADNVDKFWRHGLSPQRVIQVLDGPFRIRRNRSHRRARYILVGRDDQGQRIAIPIEPTRTATVWRPVTARFCMLP